MVKPYLIFLPLNKVLIKRIAGGVGNTFNKSNNNISIRPGATELISYLYYSDLFEIVIYSYMEKSNHIKCLKKLVNGSATGISTDNLINFDGSIMKTDINKSLINKTALLYIVNEKLHSKYNLTNTLFVDHRYLNIYNTAIEKITLMVKPYDNEEDDNVLIRLLSVLKSLETKKDVNNFAEYVKLKFDAFIDS